MLIKLLSVAFITIYETINIQDRHVYVNTDYPTFLIFYDLQITQYNTYFLTDSLKSAVAHQIVEATKVPPEPEPEPVKIKTVRKRNKFIVPEGPNFETDTTGQLD